MTKNIYLAGWNAQFKSDQYYFYGCKLFLLILLISNAATTFGQSPMKSILPEPIPSWVKDYPFPERNKDDNLDLILIHEENQFNHLKEEFFTRYFYQVKTINGLNQISWFSTYYEPDFQTFHLHKVRLHRNGHELKLEENLHSQFLYIGHQVNGEYYTDDVKVSLFLEEAKVGDLIELAFTKKGVQPDLRGSLNFRTSAENEKGTKNITRILTDPNREIYYTAMNVAVNPKRKKTNQYSIIEVIYEETKSSVEHNNSPDWYEEDQVIYFTDFSTWEEEVNLYLQNFRLEEAPSKQVIQKTKALTQEVTEHEDQIKKILDFIQGDIEYLDYDLINPKRPETVLRQQFGDCKSKSLLAIKMLECIGVEAWPVIVDIDGFDDRYLNAHTTQPLDHIIIEFVLAGDTIPYDLTDYLQHGTIQQSNVEDFRYGLRIFKGSNQFTKFNRKRNNKLSITTTVSPREVDSDDGISYKIVNDVHFYGYIANESVGLYKSRGAEKVWLDLVDDRSNPCRSKYQFTHDKHQAHAVLQQSSTLCNQTLSTDKTLIANPLVDQLTNILQSKAGVHFSRTDFEEGDFLYKLVLGEEISFTPDTFNFEEDWIKISKKGWEIGDTAYVHIYAKILKTEFPEDQYDRIQTEAQFVINRLDVLADESKIKRITEDYHSSKIEDQMALWFLISILVLFAWLIWLFISSFDQRKKQDRYIRTLEKEVATLKKSLEKSQASDKTEEE